MESNKNYSLTDIITKRSIDYDDKELLERIEYGESQYSAMENNTYGWKKGYMVDELRASFRNSLSRLYDEARRRGLATPPSSTLNSSGCLLMLLASLPLGMGSSYLIFSAFN